MPQILDIRRLRSLCVFINKKNLGSSHVTHKDHGVCGSTKKIGQVARDSKRTMESMGPGRMGEPHPAARMGKGSDGGALAASVSGSATDGRPRKARLCQACILAHTQTIGLERLEDSSSS